MGRRRLIVLDTSALVAFVKDEAGANMVKSALADCAMSSVNVSEFLTKASDRGQDIDSEIALLETLHIEFVDYTFARSIMAARLRHSTRALGLSLGDRACLALAIERQCPVMTADRAWGKLDLGVKIVVIR